MPRAFDETELRDALSGLDGWQLAAGKLVKEWSLGDFSLAFSFLTRVALLAEKHGHHPEIYNSYATVRLELVSHDAGGVTGRDIDLAKAIDEL